MQLSYGQVGVQRLRGFPKPLPKLGELFTQAMTDSFDSIRGDQRESGISKTPEERVVTLSILYRSS